MASESQAPKKFLEQADFMTGSRQVETGVISGVTFQFSTIEYSVVEGRAIAEGDIELGHPDALTKALNEAQQQNLDNVQFGAVVADRSLLWDNGIVPYQLPSQNSAIVQIVNAAIQELNQKTNIQFIPHSNEPDYIVFELSAYCSSPVGRRGGAQTIRLSPSATAGHAIHELCHSIGLWHEQSRKDRDKYIRVIWQNIKSGYEHNFRQRISDGDDIGPYDFASIMHYPSDAFSANDEATIIPLFGGVEIGQRRALSSQDIETINTLYPTEDKKYRSVSKDRTVEQDKRKRQFKVDIPAYETAKIVTSSWPSNRPVHWDVISTTPIADLCPQLSWQLELGCDTDQRINYYFTIKNLANIPISVEAWYTFITLLES